MTRHILEDNAVRCGHCDAPAVVRQLGATPRIELAHLSWCPRLRPPAPAPTVLLERTLDVKPLDPDELSSAALPAGACLPASPKNSSAGERLRRLTPPLLSLRAVTHGLQRNTPSDEEAS